MSDRRAGWLLVIVSAALGVVVTWVAHSGVRSKLSLPGALNPETWVDGAIFALQSGVFLVLMVIALDVVAFMIGKDIWVRIAAAVVAVATVVGVAAVGGVGALTAEPFAVEPAGPGTFDCIQSGMVTAPGMQEAVDELTHPGRVDTIAISGDACGGAVREVPIEDAVLDYRFQLENTGWTIDSVDATHVTARRGGLTFVVAPCGDGAEDTWIEIRTDSAQSLGGC